MDFVKLSEQRFTAKKFDVNKKIPRDDVEKLKTILQLEPHRHLLRLCRDRR